MKIRTWKCLTFAATIVSAAMISAPAGAAEYFAGKTITVQVPSGSGGTYHVYCQIVQRHLGRHIPGKPEMLIQNQPGSGGAKSASYMANAAPKNGTYIAMIAPGSLTVPLWRKVKYDGRKFAWLGAPAARAGALWVWHTHGIRTVDDLRNREVTIASTGFAAASSVWPRLMNRFLGTKMNVIYGYKGGGALNLAVERGETMGRWNYVSGFTGVRPTWLPEKKVIPILAMGPRSPELAGVPYFRDGLKDGSLRQRVYDVINMNFEVGQAFYAPPGVPGEVHAILKKAFDAMLADPETKADIERRRIEFSPKTAEQIEKLIADGFAAATPDVVAEIGAIYKKKKATKKTKKM